MQAHENTHVYTLKHNDITRKEIHVLEEEERRRRGRGRELREEAN
jgi:hypothetical protein